MAARACGTRVMGGIYAMTLTSEDGLPIEYFIKCPPVRIPDGIALAPQGQIVVSVGGMPHMLDWIGGDYANVCDWLEEGRRMGFSWHITENTALSLEPGSWALPVHPRAFILNWMEYPGRKFGVCPKAPVKHVVDQEEVGATDRDMQWFWEEYADTTNASYRMCSGYWSEDITGGEPEFDEYIPNLVKRTLPSFSYRGIARTIAPQYEKGIIARLPINAIHVINGAENSMERYDRLREKLDLPVMLMEE